MRRVFCPSCGADRPDLTILPDTTFEAASKTGAAQGADYPEPWREVLALLPNRDWRRVMVIGAPDRGKAQFCLTLLRRLAGKSPALLLDADIGRNLLPPPASVTLGRLDAEGSLAPLAFRFAGGVDPVPRLDAIVSACAALAKDVAERLIIKTCGLVNPAGRCLKQQKLAALQPDLVIALAEPGDRLDPILAMIAPERLICLEALVPAAPLNAMQWAALRLAAFERMLRGATERMLVDVTFDWLETEAPDPDEHYLCSLVDEAGRDIALGLLRRFDCASGTANVLTTAEDDAIARLRVGMILPEELRFYDPASPLLIDRTRTP